MDVKLRTFLAEDDAWEGELTYRNHIFLANVDLRPGTGINRWEMRVHRRIGKKNTHLLMQTFHSTPDDAIKAAEEYVRQVVDGELHDQ
jgi:hypothetical protein